jgi:YacP-like NYN domain
MTKPEPSFRGHVLIDGYNVLHAVLLSADRKHLAASLGEDPQDTDGPVFSWWQPAYQLRVVEWAESLHRSVSHARSLREGDASYDSAVRMTVVFDASTDLPDEQKVTSALVAVVYARSADDFIVDACRAEPALVVTADRTLVNRARRWGARDVRPWNVDVELG